MRRRKLLVSLKILVSPNSDRTWSEHVEYILDTMDYIQLHQEDLSEFEQMSKNLLERFNENQENLERFDSEQLKDFHEKLEKTYDQVESLNQKGEILLQSSASQTTEETENRVEKLLENINKSYDSLMVKTKARLESLTPTESSAVDQIVSRKRKKSKIFRLAFSSSRFLRSSKKN